VIDEFLQEIARLKEAARLLDLLYWRVGPYEFRLLLKDNELVRALERYFKFDDSE